MIKRFTVTGFKSLERVHLELGRVNVFVGANGSGKSNLLEALGVLGSAARGRVDDESLQRRGVRPGLPDRYRTAFTQAQLAATIQFKASSHEASYDVGLYHRSEPDEPTWRYSTEKLTDKTKKIVGRSPASLKKLDPAAGYAALKLVELDSSNAASQLLHRLEGYRIFSPTTPHLRGLVPDESKSRPVGLSGGHLAEAVQDLLAGTSGAALKRELLQLVEWAADVDVAPPEEANLSRSVPSPRSVVRFTDRFMADAHNHLSAYDASEGALYVMFAAVLALHPAAPRTLAIDNVDHALNPRLARALLSRFCGWVLSRPDTQVLLTAHNPVALDELPLTNDSVRLFTVDRTTSGRTKVERVRIDERILALAQQGLTLSRMWVMGLIGGVPNV
ncbi:AAA family ATPase [Archangium sp.]|uniref:AAA family ATPase n=1 Tax=Archangium sp. TaxID=1872627 RepID=UPI00286B6F11|nr:AAA family ATPase [Archangium sp.]